MKCRNPRDTNWVGYLRSLEEGLERISPKVEGVENLEETVQLISKAITIAYQDNCPEKIWKQKRNTVWWNGKLGKLRKIVRRIFNKAKAI